MKEYNFFTQNGLWNIGTAKILVAAFCKCESLELHEFTLLVQAIRALSETKKPTQQQEIEPKEVENKLNVGVHGRISRRTWRVHDLES